MNRILNSTTGLVLLVCAFLVFSVLNNTIFSTTRIDLTENNLYTLSDGTQEIVDSIDESLNIYFFFSQKSSEELPGLRTYAKRVEELLKEYELHANGKIVLHVIDPEPFSEAEDQAAEFGLQNVPINASGDSLYFGMAGTNALDDVAVIEFFQPDKEEFLEYEISKLIYSLTSPSKPIVGLISGLEVEGSMDMRTYQSTPSWTIVSQIEQLFEVKSINSDASEIPADVSMLLVIHPKALEENTLKAIDQFVMGGGRLIGFIDPLAEQDRPQANPMMPAPTGTQASEINRLMQSWGLTLRENTVLGDAQAALPVSAGEGRAPVRHLAILGLGLDNFSSQEVATAALETINMATAGVLDKVEGHTTEITPLIFSSHYAMPMDAAQLQFLGNPADLQQGFAATGEQYLIAARISGPAKTAFPEMVGQDSEDENWIESSTDIQVIIFADTDILSDRLWVQVQNFFGQRIATPFADNGDLVINVLDNMGGSASLIGVRSRGRFTRPFDVVQELSREADSRYLQKANELQLRLGETEQKLAELQDSRAEQSLLTLSPEQEQAIVDFQEEKLKIRKQLREVKHQLGKDIDDLGSLLKFINIALVPLLLTLMLLGFRFLRQSDKSRSDQSI
jgi:ABC-type uncharacterized transport system involved in gliding motility auxiliary subunit